MSKKKRLYVYALPNQMQGHKFSDDVAICKAHSKQEALAIFQRLYLTADATNVQRLHWFGQNVRVLTSY